MSSLEKQGEAHIWHEDVLKTYLHVPSWSSLTQLVALYSSFPFSFCAICLTCLGYLDSEMLHELLWCHYCVAFSKAMGSERHKAVIGLSHVLTERQIYSLLLFTGGVSKMCGFDVRFVWRLVKTPGRLEFISPKRTDMKGWVEGRGICS